MWACLLLVPLANGLGAHRAIHAAGGYGALAGYYIAWIALLVMMALRMTFEPASDDARPRLDGDRIERREAE